MLKRFSFTTVVFLLTALPVSAAPFTATYTFTGSPGNQASEPIDSNPVGAIFSDIIRGPGLDPIAGMHSINSDDWTTGSAPDLANDYYEFTITPLPGFQLDVTEFEWTFRRSATGPVAFEFRSSLDAFAAPFAGFGVPDNTANQRFGHISTGGLGSTGGLAGALDLTGPITFRLYGYNAEGSLGTFRLGISSGDAGATTLPANFEIEGDLTALTVPEPTALLLLGIGAAGLIVRTRREQKRSAL